MSPRPVNPGSSHLGSPDFSSSAGVRDRATVVPWLDSSHNDLPDPLLHRGLAERCLRRARVRDIMVSGVPTLASTSTVHEAAQKIKAGPHRCVLVVENGEPTGIITKGDMARILSEVLVTEPAAKREVRDVMTATPVCVREQQNLQEALLLAGDRRLGQFPVLDANGKVVGLLTWEALTQARLAAVERERDALERRIRNRSRELSEANRELKALALQDSLLKIGNRRAMEMDLHSTHVNAVRYGQFYALALLDVDFFKRYNDHYGHCAGDRALVSVTGCIQDSIRRGDRVYRYGGEEFLILMPETSLSEATEAVCRLTSNLHGLNLEHLSSPHQCLTVSAGVSSFAGHDGDPTWRAALEEADAFLYKAKALGRNQVYGPQGRCSVPRRGLLQRLRSVSWAGGPATQ